MASILTRLNSYRNICIHLRVNEQMKNVRLLRADCSQQLATCIMMNTTTGVAMSTRSKRMIVSGVMVGDTKSLGMMPMKMNSKIVVIVGEIVNSCQREYGNERNELMTSKYLHVRVVCTLN
jgi:hypothetical protein